MNKDKLLKKFNKETDIYASMIDEAVIQMGDCCILKLNKELVKKAKYIRRTRKKLQK